MTSSIQKEIILGRALPETMTQVEVVTRGEIKVKVTYKIDEKGIVNQNLGLGCCQQSLGERKGRGKIDRRDHDSYGFSIDQVTQGYLLA